MLTVVGSSPLARGLPRSAPTPPPRRRIIPARAGFTCAAPPTAAGAGDHPRSRGVYPVAGISVPSSRGSSPLARGLLDTGLHVIEGGRIIPARAGFTCDPLDGVAVAEDHPRSRGVYMSRYSPASSSKGSSPLARGLLAYRPADNPQSGIIPARAGFTGTIFGTILLRSDHPRSRGVYLAFCWESCVSAGSSPLARGLLAATRRHRWSGRIIPARAGFTWSAPTKHSGAADHPRSRGVYWDSKKDEIGIRGSSPLARGLLTLVININHLGRIIPARAGFTVSVLVNGGLCEDHPRSRGVYSRSDVSRAPGIGSSPLARGLPRYASRMSFLRRIIPARAGFTGRGAPARGRRADHPRSRGVYAQQDGGGYHALGSSPLARGLPGAISRSRR